jgi:site-specific recombinase XerD
MTSLKAGLEAYLTQRQNLGFKFQKQSVRLHQFVAYMKTRDAPYITIPLTMDWATRSPGHLPMWAINITDVRGFSKYLNAIDSRHEVPPVGLIPASGHCKPYLYKKKEVQLLLAAAKSLSPVNGLRRWTYHCLIGLLSVTGMRISEAVGLARTNVDLKNSFLTINNSKSGQSQLKETQALPTAEGRGI